MLPIRETPPEGLAEARRILTDFLAAHSDLGDIEAALLEAFETILESFRNNHTLYLCGNGGSYADCLHIGSELLKTFERRRPLPDRHMEALRNDPHGRSLAEDLQAGFRAVPLGLNAGLVSAILNDSGKADLHFAQELYVMAQPGDLLLAVSTSGTSANVLKAMAVARALGLKVIALTGPEGGEVARLSDVPLRLPGGRTREVQQSHLVCYHTLCLAIEAAFFPEERE
ncbi:SIS domain-containing protein [bacterium]|nr:SIS domain-containing protein [bacterium]